MVAFVGKSGGGKSTLLSLIMRMYDPSNGTIVVDGHDLRTLNIRTYHEQIGIVTQDTQLFNSTIEVNIAYGVENYTQADLYEAARNANCHDFILSFPDGYKTRIGERGTRLSGGQKQRIAIARAFLRKPRILLLDEATSALDAESEAQVQSALDRLMTVSGATVLLVAHRLSTVQNADAIAVIDNGGIAELGTHAALVAMNGTYARLVARQMAKQQNTLDAVETILSPSLGVTFDQLAAADLMPATAFVSISPLGTLSPAAGAALRGSLLLPPSGLRSAESPILVAGGGASGVGNVSGLCDVSIASAATPAAASFIVQMDTPYESSTTPYESSEAPAGTPYAAIRPDGSINGALINSPYVYGAGKKSKTS